MLSVFSECYLAVAASGFPNYFSMNGPRSNLAYGTVFPWFETELEYVIQVVKKMQPDRIRTIDVRSGITD